MGILPAGLAGLGAANDLLQRGAAALAPGGGSSDPAAGIVDLELAKVQQAASATVVRTASEMQRLLVDVFA